MPPRPCRARYHVLGLRPLRRRSTRKSDTSRFLLQSQLKGPSNRMQRLYRDPSHAVQRTVRHRLARFKAHENPNYHRADTCRSYRRRRRRRRRRIRPACWCSMPATRAAPADWRRRHGHRLGRRPHAAGGDRRLRARHGRGLRPFRLRRGRRSPSRRARFSKTWRCSCSRSASSARPENHQHRSPRSPPTIPRSRWSPTCPTCRGGTKARSSLYLDAFRELMLPQTTVLVGNHSTLWRWLLPDWSSDRSPTARDIAKAAAEMGVPYTLVTGIPLPDQFIDNVLATPQAVLAQREVRALRSRVRRRRRHLVGRAGRAAGQRHRPGRGGHRGPQLPGSLPGRRLPSRHGQRGARPPVLGPARRRNAKTLTDEEAQALQVFDMPAHDTKH